jgi:hypothetical protein
MSSYYKVNLEAFFNHKIIADNKNEISDEISNFGLDFESCLYLPSSLPDSNSIIDIGDIPFLFPDKSKYKYDNVSCEEQIIMTPNRSFSKVILLCLSEWGQFDGVLDRLEVLCTNKQILFVDLFFPTYSVGLYKMKYNICNDYFIALKPLDSTNTPRYIYMCSADIKNSDNEFFSIKLPYNPNIHIFAMTLQDDTLFNQN